MFKADVAISQFERLVPGRTPTPDIVTASTGRLLARLLGASAHIRRWTMRIERRKPVGYEVGASPHAVESVMSLTTRGEGRVA